MKFTVSMATITPKSPGRGRSVKHGVFVYEADSKAEIRARFTRPQYVVTKIVGPDDVQPASKVIL